VSDGGGAAQDVLARKRGRTIYGPILVAVPAEKLAVIVMHEVLGATLVRTEGSRWAHALRVHGSSGRGL
jgi:hypothetical protein